MHHVTEGGSGSRTKQNHYFVATEHGHGGAAAKLPGRSGQRRGSAGAHPRPFSFDPGERNKMTEVLLRSAVETEYFGGVCQVRLLLWVGRSQSLSARWIAAAKIYVPMSSLLFWVCPLAVKKCGGGRVFCSVMGLERSSKSPLHCPPKRAEKKTAFAVFFPSVTDCRSRPPKGRHQPCSIMVSRYDRFVKVRLSLLSLLSYCAPRPGQIF